MQLVQDNGLPVLYVDGAPVEGDAWLDGPESVTVSFPEVENGYASHEFVCEECGDTFPSWQDAREHHGDEHSGPAHISERNPWINSASIHMRDDEVTVCLSCGDPRGAFCMTLRNVDGQLFLSVPHPDDSYQHLPLSERWPGSYKVGN